MGGIRKNAHSCIAMTTTFIEMHQELERIKTTDVNICGCRRRKLRHSIFSLQHHTVDRRSIIDVFEGLNGANLEGSMEILV